MGKKTALALLAAILVISGSTAAQSGKRYMFGVMVPQINLGGSDFNGDNYFDLGSQIVFIPRIESAWGWGIMIGMGQDDFDAELYYMQSKHSASILTIPESANLSAIGINWRWYITEPGAFRPYVNIAVDFSFLTVSHAAVQATAPFREGDAKFNGLGICGGGGLAITPFSRLTLFAGVEFRWNPMGQVKGYEGNFQKTKDLSSSGIGFRTGTEFRF